MRKFRLVLSYDDPYLIYLFVNSLMRPHFFENLDNGLTNIWLAFHFLTKFRLNWKNSFGEATLFLKSFHFCINFINFLMNTCVDQVVLELQAWKKFLIRKYYRYILVQEINFWSTKYLKLTIKDNGWYIHEFFEPVSKTTQVHLPHFMLLLFPTLIFWYFDILTFSLITIFAFSKVRVSTLHICVLFIIFFAVLKPRVVVDLETFIKTN